MGCCVFPVWGEAVLDGMVLGVDDEEIVCESEASDVVDGDVFVKVALVIEECNIG